MLLQKPNISQLFTLAKRVAIYSDQDIVNLFLTNKQRAFDLLYNTYWEQIFVYVAKIVKDEDVAADAVQEIFISLWERTDVLEITNLRAYLYTAARYKSISYIKDNLKKNNYVERIGKFLETYDQSLEQNLEAKELETYIDIQVKKLPPKMRQIYMMSRKDMLSHKEISEQLKISDKTVKKQIGNALKFFRLKIGELSVVFVYFLKNF